MALLAIVFLVLFSIGVTKLWIFGTLGLGLICLAVSLFWEPFPAPFPRNRRTP